MLKKKITIPIVLIVAIFYFSACFRGNSSEHKTSIPETVSYNFNIRPILSDKCFKCHGPDAAHRQAHLRLDIADSAYAPLKETKGAYAIVPGKPSQSELLKRVTSSDVSYQMPPPDGHLGALSDYEKKLFEKWIEQGAKYEKHWAFTAPKKVKLPLIEDKTWPKNELDYFVLHKMEDVGLAPNEESDKERLLKRLCLDLTGLPPSLDLMDKFLADKSPEAYEKILDQLIQTPEYGERMAVGWLDVARYADSYGYQDDNIRTQWPWRDWVIRAFNKNMPFDRFVTWQIAGDMLPNATKEQILATAFLRNHKITEEGGVVPEEYRVEYMIDKVKTVGRGLLGVTIECAQCHDHKYDPFAQKDYYSLMAFFNTSKEVGYEGDVSTSRTAKTPILKIDSTDLKGLFSYLSTNHKTDTVFVSVMGEMVDTTRISYVLNRGRYDAPGAVVHPNAIPAIMKFDTTKYPRNRLGLAEWTVSTQNPLTARVFVNRLWQDFFGRGIVKSAGDFGMQGDLPTNPELLDWMAVDFMEHGWDIKRLVKQILMTATYRQSTKLTPEKLAKDPENIYLSRGPRNRLQAEFIRDLVLQSSGLLVKTIGGESVKPYQPEGLWEAASSGRGALATFKQDHGDSLYRRGMYTFIKLTVPPPSMGIFDASNRDQCEVKRSRTNTPLQALIMLNDPAVLEAARVLAQKLSIEKNTSEEKIVKSFRLIVCRRPTDKELKVLTSYYADQLQEFSQNKLNARATLDVGEYKLTTQSDLNQTAALMKVIDIMYNLEETITKS
jgi:hypothetical protein